MFVVEIGAVITSFITVLQLVTASGNFGFSLQISLWLWFTVLFANFAEAMAEARGRAQADTLRATKKETPARLLRNGHEEMVPSSQLRRGDVVLVRENEIVPGDGEVHRGCRLRQRSGNHRRVGPCPEGAGHRHPVECDGRYASGERLAADPRSARILARRSSTA